MRTPAGSSKSSARSFRHNSPAMLPSGVTWTTPGDPWSAAAGRPLQHKTTTGIAASRNRTRITPSVVVRLPGGAWIEPGLAAEELVIVFLIGWRALHLLNVEAGRLQSQAQLVERDSRSGVQLRIGDPDRQLHVIRVHAVVGFLHLRHVALRKARVVEPRAVILESVRSSDERIVVHPSADRVTPPPRLRRQTIGRRPRGLLRIL